MFSGYSLTILHASWLTLGLALCSLVLGLLLSILFAGGEMSRFKWVAWPFTFLVTVIRGLPELLVVLFISYGLPELIFYITNDYPDINPFILGVLALSLIFASYAAQTLRGALKAVPKGQAEAATALGLPKLHAFVRIILPQAIRHALPGLANQWLVLLKDTALVSLIGVTDLLKQTQLIIANPQNNQQTFTWFAIAAGIYLIITLLTQQIIGKLNKKYQLQDANMTSVHSNKKSAVGA